MNIAPPKKIVLLGFLSQFPVAGVAWQTIHYLVGFERLGFEVAGNELVSTKLDSYNETARYMVRALPKVAQ